MYTDRLTLTLAYRYIYGAGNIVIVNSKAENGIVSDITFSYSNKYTDPNNSRLIRFNSIADLVNKIEVVGTTSILQAECSGNMGIYELRSFTVTTNTGAFAIVKNESSGWATSSAIISQDQIYALNNEYQSTYNRTKKLYNDLEYVEYIENQQAYIDCGYIRRWFGSIVDELTQLYSTYNNKYKDKNTL